MRIVAFAYACEPARGSEPGAGWAWARMLARMGETWVITRRDYQDSIQAALSSIPERENLHFVYAELPERFRGWQRDLRGLRVYYLLWQIAALKEAIRLQRSRQFDVVWHLTWATAWYGTLASFAGTPFVYGPVGGCVGTVWRLFPPMGWKGTAYEVARAAVHGAARYANPLARRSWRKADLILAQNDETRDWFPRKHRAKVAVFPNAVIREESDPMTGAALRNSGGPVAIFAGRLEPFKGVFLALHTLAQLPDWRLVICGSGDDEQRMRTLARRLGIEPRVEWTGWLSQDEVLMRMTKADVLLFPCLHEEAGAVVVEARAAGLPVVCLDRGGPRLLIGPDGIGVSASGSMEAITRRLAEASKTCLEARRTSVVNPRMENLTLALRAQDLQALLIERLDLPSDSISAPPGG